VAYSISGTLRRDFVRGNVSSGLLSESDLGCMVSEVDPIFLSLQQSSYRSRPSIYRKSIGLRGVMKRNNLSLPPEDMWGYKNIKNVLN
jgi:hypothetical protein